MHEVSSNGRTAGGSGRREWLLPGLLLATSLTLVALSWQGVFFSRATVPWIAGGVLALAGIGRAFRHRKRRGQAAVFLVAALCAASAPAAQRGRQLLENGRTERAVMADVGGRPAPPVSYVEVVGEEVPEPLYGDGLVILNFWATWCPPCVKEMPVLQAFADEHRDRPVRVVGITAFYGAPDDDRKQILELRRARGVTYPTLVAADRENLDAFRVRSLPTTVLVDGGRLVGYGIGIRGAERILEEADRRLGERRRSEG